MNNSKKIVINMIAIYSKIVITMLISLYTLPLVLKVLGANDYGLFTLVLGVVTLLTFLNGSMTVSTQRFMSISMGANDKQEINRIFNVSILLHYLVGLFVIVILEVLSLFLFDGFLNIESNRINAAQIVYQCLIASTFFTIIAVPYDAMINANEDFVLLSIIEILQSILILLLTIALHFVAMDKLIFYGIGMASVAIIIMVVKRIVCKRRYKGSLINIHIFDPHLFKKMFSFAGWNTFGAIAMMGRNQGIAVILNLFCGTVVNAAYGIANQINNVLSNFSITLQKSINPQLMKSEGGNDRTKMLYIAFISSKFSVYILSFFALPLIIEMPYILKIWLKQVPEDTILFSQLILILSIVYQYSVGIMSAIQSSGKIKNYQIIMGTLLFINLPISYIFLRLDYPTYYVLICLIVVEIISLITRILFSKNLVSLDVVKFVKEIILPTLCVLAITFVLSVIPSLLLEESFLRLTFTGLLSVSSMFFLVWHIGLQSSEKERIYLILFSFFKKERDKTIYKN